MHIFPNYWTFLQINKHFLHISSCFDFVTSQNQNMVKQAIIFRCHGQTEWQTTALLYRFTKNQNPNSKIQNIFWPMKMLVFVYLLDWRHFASIGLVRHDWLFIPLYVLIFLLTDHPFLQIKVQWYWCYNSEWKTRILHS